MAAVTTQSETKTVAVPSIADRVANLLLLLLVLAAGLAVGTVGSFFHRAEFYTGSIGWPDGLLLSLGGLVGLLLGLLELLPVTHDERATVPARLSGLAAAGAGWVVAVIRLTYVGPPFSFANKGDVILANDWISMAYLILGMALTTVFLYRGWIASLDAKLAGARG
jgi:cyanate permease